MAAISGRGLCEIPNENGLPCARQIAQGEPHGSAFVNRRYLQGHKQCADQFHARKAAEAREAREKSLVQRMDQDGPGGPVNLSAGTDALEGGSVPLAPPENSTADHRLADLPLDATPADAVAFAKGESRQEFNTVGPRTLQERIEEVRTRRAGGGQRHMHHEPNEAQSDRMEHIRTLGATLDAAISTLAPPCPEREQALHYADLAVMCANAAIARHAHLS